MAVTLKSRQEIAQLREAGRIVAETYEILRPYVKPGTTTTELDQIAEDYIRGKGAKPIYKGYGARPARNGFPAIPAFPATICVAVNDVICHGIPSPKQILREGDIIGVDIGVLYKGSAIQTYAESQGFSTVREYVGHGVGRSLHEDPQVPHHGHPGTGLRLRPGMVFTIEPMINAGGYQTKVLADKWTVCTADGSRSAQFEHTIAITDGEPELLTVI